MIIKRPKYIEAITPFIGQPLVKILSGVRRCGKSTIFDMLKEELLSSGIEEKSVKDIQIWILHRILQPNKCMMNSFV